MTVTGTPSARFKRVGGGDVSPTELVVGHANPDFDAYASTVAATKLFPGAMGVFLGSQNANVREFHNLHEDFVDFVDLKGLDTSRVKRLIMVDTRDAGRIGELGPVATRAGVEVIVYDHHPPGEGDLPGVEDRSAETGATTSILVHEIRSRGIQLTPLEASVMLLGIHEDTGSLTYPSSTPYDADAVTFLMSAGADLEVVNQFLSRVLTPAQQRLLGLLTDTLEVRERNGQAVAVCWAETAEYVDSASVVTHYIVEDMGYRVAFAVVKMGDRIHVVGRSRIGEVDVAAVLGHLGGGGHAQAASASIKSGGLNDVLERLDEALVAELHPALTAHDIMSSPVRGIAPDESMADAAEIMVRWGHGGLPVISRGKLMGLVTRKDVDKAGRHRLDHAPVRGFMARDIVTVPPEMDLVSLESLLAREGIGRVPVVVGRKVVGIVTRKDLLRAEHGEHYLDRRVPQARAASSKRFMGSLESLMPNEVREVLGELGRVGADRGERVHVVGGFVRDMLLARRNLDIDLVVEGDGVGFALEAGEKLGVRVTVHRRFGTAVLVFSRDLHVDVASSRSEYYTRPGALPTVERSTLRQDLFRRDFSINAMAASLAPASFGVITDPFGGLRDLERGIVRALHSLSFVEDPTRVLRCARFAERYRFTIEPTTEQLAREAIDMKMLEEVSGARVREELLDIIDEDAPSKAFARLVPLGAMAAVVAEGTDPKSAVKAMAAIERGYIHLEGMFARPPRRRTTLVLAFVHGAERADAERWLRRMRFGKEYGEGVLAVHDAAGRVSRLLAGARPMRDSRLHTALAPMPAETLVYLWATGGKRVRERVELFVRELARIKPAVNGADLLAMGYEASPAFAAILAQARADRLDGKTVGRKAELANLKRIAERVLG